jgi:peptidyl-prolyl cis-trans isomerase D
MFLWGGQDALQMLGVSRSQTLAHVGDHKIMAQDVEQEVYRDAIRLQFQTGRQLTSQDIKDFGLREQALQRLIMRTLIQNEADRLGLTISDAEVAASIKSTPLFLTPEGAFSKDRFQMVINRLGFAGEKDYVLTVKEDLLRERLFDLMSGSFELPEAYADDLYRWAAQVRTLKVYVVNPHQETLKTQPSEDDLRAFYAKHRAQFAAPENRTYDVLVMDLKHLEKNVSVDEKAVEDMFEARKDKPKDPKEAQAVKDKIRATLLEESVEEKASAAAKDIETAFDEGKSFAELAKQFNLVHQHVDKQEMPAEDDTSENATFARSAFAQEADTLGAREKLEGQKKAFYVLVTNVQEAKALSFKEALPKATERYTFKLKLEQAEKRAKDMATNINQGAAMPAGTTAPVTIEVSRQGMVSQKPALVLMPQAIQGAFHIPRGKASLLPHQNDKRDLQILVVQVTHVGQPATVDKKAQAQFKERMAQSVTSDLIEQYMGALEGTYHVEMNKLAQEETRSQPVTQEE